MCPPCHVLRRDDHSAAGVIVPPPPERSSLAAVAVKVSGGADLNESVAGKIIERRCVALDRFVSRKSQLQDFQLGEGRS